MIEELVKEDWFKTLKQKAVEQFTSYNKEQLEKIIAEISSNVTEWKYATGSYFSFIPYSQELNKQKKGRLLPAYSETARYVSYGFNKENELLLETWNLSGDRDKFGAYYYCKINNGQEFDLLFLHVHPKLNQARIQAITTSYVIEPDKKVYLSINGIKDNSWALRVDVYKDNILQKIYRYDPASNLETRFDLFFSTNYLEKIEYNGKQYWPA